MPIIIGLLGLFGIGAETAGVVGTVVGVVIWLMRIHTIIALVMSAFWFLVVYFAHDVFSWIIGVMFSLVAGALSIMGLEDPTDRILTLIRGLPPGVLALFSRLHLFSHAQAIFKAYAINWALSSIPLVGRLFRS